MRKKLSNNAKEQLSLSLVHFPQALFIIRGSPVYLPFDLRIAAAYTFHFKAEVFPDNVSRPSRILYIIHVRAARDPQSRKKMRKNICWFYKYRFVYHPPIFRSSSLSLVFNDFGSIDVLREDFSNPSLKDRK